MRRSGRDARSEEEELSENNNAFEGWAILERYRAHNEEMILDALVAGAAAGGSFAGGQVHRNGEHGFLRPGLRRGRRGGSAPVGEARHAQLSSPDVQISEGILERAVERLRRENFPLYYNLLPVFFGEDATPSLLDQWREAAEAGDEELAPRLAMVRKALALMLAETERQLAGMGRRRLVVPDPETLVDAPDKRSETERARKRARAAYYRHLEVCEMEGIEGRAAVGEAARRTAAETGYNQREVRRIRSQRRVP